MPKVGRSPGALDHFEVRTGGTPPYPRTLAEWALTPGTAGVSVLSRKNLLFRVKLTSSVDGCHNTRRKHLLS